MFRIAGTDPVGSAICRAGNPGTASGGFRFDWRLAVVAIGPGHLKCLLSNFCGARGPCSKRPKMISEGDHLSIFDRSEGFCGL
jgi:hypothetical protein